MRYTMDTHYSDGDTFEGEPFSSRDDAFDSISWDIVDYVQIHDSEAGTVRTYSRDPR